MIRVAITDDHLMVIKGLTELLSQLPGIELSGTYMSLGQTGQGLQQTKADILLLDLNLPDGDGITYCKELKKKYPDLKIIAITTYDQVILIKNTIKNGASGFLLKNATLKELDDAIRTVYNGNEYLQEQLKERLLSNTLGAKPKNNSLQPVLSRREKEILQLIVDECTTQEIADRLFIAVKTVEAHRSHLIEKLGVKNLAGLVKAAIEKGLC